MPVGLTAAPLLGVEPERLRAALEAAGCNGPSLSLRTTFELAQAAQLLGQAATDIRAMCVQVAKPSKTSERVRHPVHSGTAAARQPECLDTVHDARERRGPATHVPLMDVSCTSKVAMSASCAGTVPLMPLLFESHTPGRPRSAGNVPVSLFDSRSTPVMESPLQLTAPNW